MNILINLGKQAVRANDIESLSKIDSTNNTDGFAIHICLQGKRQPMRLEFDNETFRDSEYLSLLNEINSSCKKD